MASETAVGAKSRIAHVKEATWGTTPSGPSTFGITFVTESLKLNTGIVEDESIRSDRGNAQPIQGNFKPAGDINVVWSADSHARLLWSMIGGAVTDAGSGPYYDHTFSEYTSPDLPSSTIEKGFTDIAQYFIYAGARMNQATFRVAPENTVKGALSVMSLEAERAGSPIDATPTEVAAVPLNSFSGTITEDSVLVSTCTDISLTLVNNITGVMVIGSQFYGALLAGRLKITGSLTAFFVNGTMYDRFRNFEESSVILKMQDALGGYIQMHIPSIRYGGDIPVVGGEGPLFIPLEFTAYTDPVALKQILVAIHNRLTEIDT